METLHSNFFQFFVIEVFTIFIVWLIHTQIQNAQLIKSVLSHKEPQEAPEIISPKSWTKAEVLILAYLLVYKEGSCGEILENLSLELRRSPSSIKRKLLRLKYSNSNGTEMDRNVIRFVAIVPRETVKNEVLLACRELNLDNQTVTQIFL